MTEEHGPLQNPITGGMSLEPLGSPPARALTPPHTHTHTDESHTGKQIHTLTGCVCLYTPRLCDPAEMSTKTDNPTIIHAVPSTVNNSIWALFNHVPVKCHMGEIWCRLLFQMGSRFIHSLLYSQVQFSFFSNSDVHDCWMIVLYMLYDINKVLKNDGIILKYIYSSTVLKCSFYLNVQ